MIYLEHMQQLLLRTYAAVIYVELMQQLST